MIRKITAATLTLITGIFLFFTGELASCVTCLCASIIISLLPNQKD